MMSEDGCPRRRELGQYFDGSLPDELVGELERHLSTCHQCVEHYESLAKQTAPFIQRLKAISGISDRQLNPVDPPEQLPRIFGSYHLLHKIGEGGIGAVYFAEHLERRSVMAIKILKSRFLADQNSRDRFLREIAAVSKLDHPAIVRASDSGEVDGVWFLAMDYIDGVDLSSLLKQIRRIPAAAACEIARRAGGGLLQIHSAGMVHRDVKPGNFILAKNGAVQILDFGLALNFGEASSDHSALTEPGQLMGTVDYIAPEQANDTHRVDYRADVYGLGATLFAMLTGEPPYGRSKLSLLQKLSKLANEPPKSLTTLIDDVPPALVAAIEKSLAKRPEDRFQSMHEFISAIEPFASSAALADFVQSQVDFPIRPSTLASQSHKAIESATAYVSPAAETTSARGNSRMPGSALLESLSDRSETQQRSPERLSRIRFVLATVAGCMLIAFSMLIWNGSGDRSIPPSPGASTNESSHAVDAALRELAGAPAEHDALWRIFSREHLPDQRSAILHQAQDVLPMLTVVDRYCGESDASIRAGLLLAISEYTAAPSVFGERPQFEARLRSDYLLSSDSELHSAIELLLKRTGRQAVVEELDSLLRQRNIQSGWYRPLLAPTMIVVHGPRQARLGSPPTEAGRMTNTDLPEDLREANIQHSYAISSTEVTRRLYARLTSNYWEKPEDEFADTPQNAITWDDAARFCNLLSAAEGLPPEEYCYEQTLDGTRLVMRPSPNALLRRGFRLPTETEWETACRAGISDARYFGNETVWLKKFALGGQTTTRLQCVGLLKPNPFGLFDLLGNASEWTHDSIELRGKQTGHVIRGGSASSRIEMLRSAARYYYLDDVKSEKVGFRVAQTLPSFPSDDTSPEQNEPLRLSIGPAWSPGSNLAAPEDSDFRPLRSGETVNFGLWKTSESPRRWFRLENTSAKSIRLDCIPELSDGFQYVVSPSLEIASGESTVFCVSSSPIAHVGTHSCVFFMTLDGENVDQAPQVNLLSRFHGPLLQVLHVGYFASREADMSVGNLPLGSTLGVRLYVLNVGDEPAIVNVAGLEGDLLLAEEISGPVFPHRLVHSVRVNVGASKLGATEGRIKLTSPQLSGQEFVINIAANVLPNDRCDAIGVYRGGTWLIDWNHDGQPDERVSFGEIGDQPFTGDFDCDGICDLGVWRQVDAETVRVRFYRRGKTPSPAGFPDQAQIKAAQVQRVVAMDRDLIGRSAVCYLVGHDQGSSLMWMADINDALHFDRFFELGKPGDVPFVADWNGDGVDDFGVTTPGTDAGEGRLKVTYFWSGMGDPRVAFALSPTDQPLAGDWDGDGDDEIGGWRPPIERQPAIWQFDVDGDFESDRDLEGFGVKGDFPFILRADRRSKQQ